MNRMNPGATRKVSGDNGGKPMTLGDLATFVQRAQEEGIPTDAPIYDVRVKTIRFGLNGLRSISADNAPTALDR
jgi:hypothetical protein